MVYGNRAFNINEEADLNPSSFSEGYIAIANAMRDPRTVNVISGNGRYYVTSESVMQYMSSACVTEIDEALYDIANANGIDYNLLETVGMFDDDCLSEFLKEDAVLLEKAAEDNAMTLKQAEKYYRAVLKNCKSKADTKDTIDDCIKLLKQCVKDMQQAKAKAQSNLLDGGRIKYALKSFIPFNGIYRLFKRNDWQAGISELADFGIGAATNIIVHNISREGAKAAVDAVGKASNYYDAAWKVTGIGLDTAKKTGKAALGMSAAGTAVTLGIRLGTYTKMLDRMIKNTNEAIDYLEKKRKELDKK